MTSLFKMLLCEDILTERVLAPFRFDWEQKGLLCLFSAVHILVVRCPQQSTTDKAGGFGVCCFSFPTNSSPSLPSLRMRCRGCPIRTCRLDPVLAMADPAQELLLSLTAYVHGKCKALLFDSEQQCKDSISWTALLAVLVGLLA